MSEDHVKELNQDKDEQKKLQHRNIKRLGVGAASVILGTSFYLGGTANADTNADQAANTNNQDPDTNQNTQATADQMDTNKALQTGTTTVTLNHNQAQETAPVADDAYQVTSTPTATVTDGAQPSDSGNVQLHADLSLDSSKIKAGNYIDFKMGAPTADGKYANYSSVTADDIPVTINNVQVGEITSQGDGGYAYYRLQFNNNITTIKNPKISVNLVWKSLIQKGLTLNAYSHNKSLTTYKPQDDIVIGSHTYTSGISIPVTYVSPTGSQVQDHATTEVKAGNVGTSHVWTTNADGSQSLSVRDMTTAVEVALGDKLSNNVDITVETPIQTGITTTWKTNDEVRQQIVDILKKSLESAKITNLLRDGQVGISIETTNPDVPEVTVTSDDPTQTNEPGTLVNHKTYHIVINTDQPIKLGGQTIDLAEVTVDKSYLTQPSDTTTYDQDMATYKVYTSENQVGGNQTGIVYRGWLANGSYLGTSLANKDMQNYLTNHFAAWVAIKDNGNSANNDGDDGYVNLGGSTQDWGDVNFVMQVRSYNANNGSDAKNSSNGSGDQNVTTSKITVTYIDTTTGKVLSTVTKEGKENDDSGYSTINDINNFKAQHYILISDDTNGAELTFQNEDKAYTVHLGHETQTVNDSKKVTETIHYVFTDGTSAATDYQATPVTFSRTGQKDMVTNETNWNAWEPDQATFPAVTSPTVDGYTPDQAEVAAKTVKATDDTNEVLVVVKYTKNAQPSDQPTSQPSDQPTSQPTNQPTSQPTSQPTNQPTNQPTSQPTNQPTSQPTNPNQPTSASEPDHTTNTGTTVINPIDPSQVIDPRNLNHRTTTTTNGGGATYSQPVTTTSTNTQGATTGNSASGSYQWVTEAVKVPNSSSNQNSELPQTGNANNKQSRNIFLIILEAFLALLGISLGGKKKQDN